jgi:hypothetical protein
MGLMILITGLVRRFKQRKQARSRPAEANAR